MQGSGPHPIIPHLVPTAVDFLCSALCCLQLYLGERFLFADDVIVISLKTLPCRACPVPCLRLLDRRFAAILQSHHRYSHVLRYRVADDVPLS